MEVRILTIRGPIEPTFHAVATVQLSDGHHSLTIRDLEVLEHNGTLGVSFPNPRQEEEYGGGSLFELSKELRQAIADSVLDAHDQGVSPFSFGQDEDLQPKGFELVFRSVRKRSEIG